MPKAFFEEAADALVGFLPRDLRGFSSRTGGHNLKVWFGEEAREHYEIQMLSRAALSAAGIRAAAPALEIGFHAEHPEESHNEEALAALVRREKTWRKSLGRKPAAGRFAGRQATWRRISEVWEGGNLTGGETAIEAAERLAAYVRAFEPLRARAAGRSR